jgi:hypothetical protein
MKTIKIKKETTILEIVMQVMKISKSAAKRLIKQGGVTLYR